MAYAQARARRGSQALGTFGKVGRTDVSVGTRLGQEGRHLSASRASAGNFAGYSGQMGHPVLPRRQLANPRSGLGRPNIGVYNAFANPLDHGLMSRYTSFARDYTGRQTWATTGSARYGEGLTFGKPYMALQVPRKLLFDNAFLAPVRDADKGGRIRDQLTNNTLLNIPQDLDKRLDPAIPRQTYSEMLEARLHATHAKNLKRGWECFSEGDYLQATRWFRSTSNWPGHQLECTLGILFSGLASGQRDTAFANASRLVNIEEETLSPDAEETEHINPFACDLNLHSLIRPLEEADQEDAESEPIVLLDRAAVRREHLKPWSENRLNDILDELALESENPVSVKIPATYSVVLWYTDQRDEALRIAENLRRDFRTEPFAQFALDMQEIMDREAQVDAGEAAAP
jgi:hypothetical protein